MRRQERMKPYALGDQPSTDSLTVGIHTSTLKSAQIYIPRASVALVPQISVVRRWLAIFLTDNGDLVQRIQIEMHAVMSGNSP